MNIADLHHDRRRFMKMMALAAGTPMMGNLMQAAYAAGPFNDYRAMVCVFLFGGNDAQNMIIPLGVEHGGYASGRGNLAIPQANALPVSAGVPGRSFGFHPSLTGLANIFNTDKKLACVNNVSVLLQPTTLTQYNNEVNLPPNLFSHSDMQNHWQTVPISRPRPGGWAPGRPDRIGQRQQLGIGVDHGCRAKFVSEGSNVVSYAVSGWSNTKSTIVKRMRSYRSWDNFSATRPNPQAVFEGSSTCRVSTNSKTSGATWRRVHWRPVNSSTARCTTWIRAAIPVKDAQGNVSEKFPISPTRR